MGDPVVRIAIVEYDPRWPSLYEAERARLAAVLNLHVVSIEHIGSTAVPGLPAKSLIDILVTVDHLGSPDGYIQPLRSLGYTYFPVLGNSHRYSFGKGVPHTHHVHIVEHGGDEHRRPIVFRDYLRSHPEAARQYAVLKRELAVRFHGNRHAYNAAKTDFIRSIEARALRGTGEDRAASDV
jgi:GrpB-like predicted nucleotidyltransferase (UPF0157 family)